MQYFLKPWAHQMDAINQARFMRNFALFFEVGAGKTLTAINIHRHWCAQENKMLSALVIGVPAIVKQ